MKTANLVFMSVLLSLLTSNDNNFTNHLESIDFYGGRAFSIADVTKVNLHDIGNRNDVFNNYLSWLIMKSDNLPLNYKTSDNRLNNKNIDIKKWITLHDNTQVKKKQEKVSALKIQNSRDNKIYTLTL